MRIYCHPLVVDLDLRTQELDSCSNLAEKCVEHKRVHEHNQKQGQGVAEHEERELEVHLQSLIFSWTLDGNPPGRPRR